MQELIHKFGNNYRYEILEDNVIKLLCKVRVTCMKHSEVVEDLVINLLHKEFPCMECVRENIGIDDGIIMKKTRKKWELLELIGEFENIHKDKFMYHDLPYSFKGLNKKVWIKCVKHNHFFKQTPSNHITGKICCPKCLEELANS